MLIRRGRRAHRRRGTTARGLRAPRPYITIFTIIYDLRFTTFILLLLILYMCTLLVGPASAAAILLLLRLLFTPYYAYHYY